MIHSGNKILLVDDDKALVELYTSVLSEANHSKVEYAYSGDEALKKLDQFLPDILLLNYKMPGMDGTETLRRIRKLPHQQDTPVIFLTSKTAQKEELTDCDHHVYDVLFKPLQTSALIMAINSALHTNPPTGIKTIDMGISELKILFTKQAQENAELLVMFLNDLPHHDNPGDVVNDALYNYVHKIAGTAAVFGYPELAPLADRLELYFDNLDDVEPSEIDGIKHEVKASAEKLLAAINEI